MKRIIFLLPILLLIACNNSHSNRDTTQVKEEKHEGHKGKETHSGAAKEHMHRSSVENLIDRFESPERDEYQQPDKVLGFLGDIRRKTIMDIGAGSGYFSVKLAEKGAKVIAADVDDEFQAFIKSRIEQDGLKNIQTRKIPYDSPGLKDGEVDMVFIVNTYHHIENRTDYFSEVKAGTKADGELIIIDFFKSETPVGPSFDHKISIDQVVSELKQAGYNSFEVNVDLLPYQYIIRAHY